MRTGHIDIILRKKGSSQGSRIHSSSNVEDVYFHC